ncbi:hypothetical protein Pfo_010816 [Paulownia fortunei]|nr:hypothetical protein Pfo_010816 [Paulownia fortunei]
MGRKIVSFLCGGLTRKKTPPPNPVDENPKTENSDFALIPKDASTKPRPSSGGGDSPEEHARDTAQLPQATDEQQSLPPPPGRQQQQHLRAASYHHQHQRSNSAASKLVSSLSVRVRGSGGDKKLKHEDSIWKKTIILGEKCKVPDEDEDAILYDENGNRISTYHRKNTGSSMSFSRQNSCTDQDSDPPRLGSQNQELSRK